MHYCYEGYLKKYAQNNRKITTKSESLLRNMVLKSNRTGFRFLRQKPITGYILDFYCPKLKLAIEIDGCSHDEKGEYDYQRDDVLRSLGIITIRIHDTDVVKHLGEIQLYIYLT